MYGLFSAVRTQYVLGVKSTYEYVLRVKSTYSYRAVQGDTVLYLSTDRYVPVRTEYVMRFTIPDEGKIIAIIHLK